jgi:hypothetical protein
LGLGVAARDDLLLCPILLQRSCRGSVRVGKSLCESNHRVRKQRERAEVGKQRGKHIVKSVLQSQQAGLKFAVPGAPNADFLVMPLTVKLSKSFQLIDLSIAALDFALQRCAKLVHLTIVLRREDSSLLGQLVVKLQPQRRLRLSSLCQLRLQLLSPGSLSSQALKLLRMLLFE